jgi:hypothetical protein
MTEACSDLPTALPKWDLIARLLASPELWLALIVGRTVYTPLERAHQALTGGPSTDERISNGGEGRKTVDNEKGGSVSACGS